MKEYKIPFVDTADDKFVSGKDSVLTLHDDFIEWHWDNKATVKDEESNMSVERRHFGRIRILKKCCIGVEMIWQPTQKCFNVGVGAMDERGINIFIDKLET